jgi:hypothetical protein
MKGLWVIVLVGLLAASEAKKKIIRNKFDGDFEFAEEVSTYLKSSFFGIINSQY